MYLLYLPARARDGCAPRLLAPRCSRAPDERTASRVPRERGTYFRMSKRRSTSDPAPPPNSEKIGEGTHGIVYSSIDKDHKLVAIKRFKSQREGVSTTAYREMALLRNIEHDNIIKLLDIHVVPKGDGPSVLSLLFEHVAGGDLAQKLRSLRSNQQHLAPCAVRSLMHQLCSGLAHLHRCKVMHRDIKPANLLLDTSAGEEHSWRLKITDFGLARLHDAPLRPLGLDGPVVTAWYRAPELLLGATTHGNPVDCWSAGCILGECLSGHPLFPGEVNEEGQVPKEQLMAIIALLGPPSEAVWPSITALRHWRAVRTWPELSGTVSPIVRNSSTTAACSASASSHAHAHATTASSAGTPTKLEAMLMRSCARPLTAEILALLRGLLAYDPDRRTTADEALNSAALRLEASPRQSMEAPTPWVRANPRKEVLG